MGLSFTDKGSFNKDKWFSIASGAASVSVAVYFGYVLVQRLGLGIPLATASLLIQIATIAAMVLCAVYAFGVLYGKQPGLLLGLAAALVAAIHIYLCITSILNLIHWGLSITFTALYFNALHIIRNMLISIIFSVISWEYLSSRVKINIKSLPIIAIAVVIASTVIFSFIGNFNLTLRNILLGPLQFIPFLLLISICSRPAGSIKKDEAAKEEQGWVLMLKFLKPVLLLVVSAALLVVSIFFWVVGLFLGAAQDSGGSNEETNYSRTSTSCPHCSATIRPGETHRC